MRNVRPMTPNLEEDDSLRSRPQDVPRPSFDPAIFGPLYREFAAEDREIAELGMSDYAPGLRNEENG
jgi:hypothetical protein